MICFCVGRIDEHHVRAVIASAWMRAGGDGIISSTTSAITTTTINNNNNNNNNNNGTGGTGTPTLFCALCDRLGPASGTKKKSKFREIFRSKHKEEAEAAGDGGGNDLLMCLSCASCFCVEHAKNHYDENRRCQGEGNVASAKHHYIFFGIPGIGERSRGQSNRSSISKYKLIFPDYYVDGIDKIRENGPISLRQETSLHFSVKSNSHDWSYVVWCMHCSEKPAQLLGTDYTNSQAPHVCLKILGDTIAKQVYLFRNGIRIEFSTCDEAISRSITYSGEANSSWSRSGVDFLYKPGAQSDLANRASYNSSMVTSTGFIRNSNKDAEAAALAHIAGIENRRNTCYFNSVLQCVLKCEYFTRPLLEIGEASLPGALSRRIHAMICHLKKETIEDVMSGAVYPYARGVLQRLSEIAPMFAEDEQQDCQELFLAMVNGVADEFDKGKSEEEKKKNPRISFEGVLRTEVACEGCCSCFPREEIFMALSVPVEDSIEEGLAKLFHPTHMCEKDQYACEVCFNKLSESEQRRHNAAIKEENEKKERNKKKSTAGEEKKSLNCIYSNAVVQTSISQLGGSLALHLLRFHYDGRDFQKTTRNVKFPLSLDLTPFVSKDVLHEYERVRGFTSLQSRYPEVSENILLQCFESAGHDLVEAERILKEKLPPDTEAKVFHNNNNNTRNNNNNNNNNKPGKSHTDVSAAESSARGEEASTDGVTPSSISTSIPAITKTIHNNNNNNNNNSSSSSRGLSPPALRRDLVGIVTHRGSLHGGHYIAYVRDINNSRLWFRCDDEEIERVDAEYVLQCKSEVYMLFYE